MATVTPGTLLTGPELERTLKSGRAIARADYDELGLRGGAYYLHLSSDLVSIPKSRRREEGLIVAAGEAFTELELHPGETAVVACKERIQLAWDLVGTLGSKASLTLKGLHVQTGLVVDPGYGLAEVNGSWAPKVGGSRLYFVVTNTSSATTTLRAGEALVRLQLYSALEPTRKEPTGVDLPGFFESGRGPDRRLFSGLQDFENLTHDFKNLKDNVQVEVDAMTTHLTNLILFGVFLLAVSVLGVCLTVGLSIAGDVNFAAMPDINKFVALALLLAFVVATFGVTLAATWSISRNLGKVRDRQADRPS